MANAESPLAPVEAGVQRFSAYLQDLLVNVLKKLKPMVAPALAFFDELIKNGKAIASKVGDNVLDTIKGFVDEFFDVLPTLTTMVKSALKLGQKILAMIAKAADPMKIVRTVKKIFARFVMLLRQIFARVSAFLARIAPVQAVLGIINSMKTLLQVVFRWIANVTKANSVVKKVAKVMKKVEKAMKAEVKMANKLLKEVNKLRPA